MLLAGWEIRIGKNCDRGLENAARGRGPRAAFSSPRSQFFPLYGPTLSRPITFLSFYSCRKLAHKWVCLSNFAIESAFALSTIQTIRKKSNERTNEQIKYYTKKDVLKNRFISNYFMLVHLVPQLRSPKLFSRCKISCKV